MGKNPLLSKTLWANVLGVAALVLQSEYGYLVPPQYQAIGLAAVNLGLRMITGQPIDWKKVKLSGLGMLLLLLTAGLSAAPLLSGCALLGAAKERPVLTELAIRAAVGRVLDEHPDWVEPARQIAGNAIALIDESDQATLGMLESYVTTQIPWNRLSLEERELVAVLIRAVREEAEIYLKNSGIETPEEAAVVVARVMGWIYQSAEIRSTRSALFGPGFDAAADAAIEQAAARADARLGL